MKLLHRVIFGKPGQASKLKKNLYAFCGIDPKTEAKVHDRLTKCSGKDLRLICSLLKKSPPGKASEKDDVIKNSLMPFLRCPTESKKRKAPPAEKAANKPVKQKKATQRPKIKDKIEEPDDEPEDSEDEDAAADMPGEEEDKSKEKTKTSTEGDADVQDEKVKQVTDEELTAKIDEIVAAGSMEDLTMRAVKDTLGEAFGDALDMQVHSSACFSL